jgi:hypothetical protein
VNRFLFPLSHSLNNLSYLLLPLFLQNLSDSLKLNLSCVCALSQAHVAPISSAVNLCPLRQQNFLRELKCRMKTNIYPSLPHIKWKNIFPVNYHLFILKCEILTTILLGKKIWKNIHSILCKITQIKGLKTIQSSYCRESKHTFQI